MKIEWGERRKRPRNRVFLCQWFLKLELHSSAYKKNFFAYSGLKVISRPKQRVPKETHYILIRETWRLKDSNRRKKKKSILTTHQYRSLPEKEFQYTKIRTLPKLRLVLTHIVGQKHLPNLLHSNPIKRKDDSHSYGGHSRAICPENDGTDCALEKGKKDEKVPLANNLIHSRITCECFRIASPVSMYSWTWMNWQLFSLYSGCSLILKSPSSHLLVFTENIHNDVTQEKFLVCEHLWKLTATSSFEMVKTFICWTKLQLE